MTDRFPAFDFDESPDDLTHLAVPDATPMNRWAVFFRVILGIPVSVFVGVLELGTVVIQVVMWFVVLVTGWLPAPVHDAYRALFRYSARSAAYALLLVPTYAWGPFGDKVSVSGVVASAAGAPGGPSPQPSRTVQRPWDIVLSKGARWVIVAAIVLGVPSYVGLQAVYTVTSPAYQRSQLIQANNALVTEIGQYLTNIRACRSNVPCLESNDHTIAEQLTAFATTLGHNANSGIDQAVADTARSDAVNLAGLLYLAANAGPTKDDYRSTVNQIRLGDAEIALQTALTQLQQALNNP